MNLIDLSKLESRLNTIDKRLDKIEKTLFKKEFTESDYWNGDIPDDKFEEQGDLPAVKEYFKDRYGSVTASTATSNGSTPSPEAVKLDELF